MKIEKTFVIRNRYDGKKIFSFKCLSLKICVEIAVELGVSLDYAILDGAILDGASLNRASLNYASLDGAIMDGASLNRAILDGAILDGASLNRASLDGASLDGASLNRAILDGAILNYASLDGASLDFSCLPLWCGSLKANFDDRQIKQFLYHVLSGVKNSVHVSEELKCSILTTDLLMIANEFHRTDCERL